MATISNGWYKGSIPFYEITEIRIASTEYVSTEESWDGSAAQDGSIQCYRSGTKVRIVCGSVTEIGEKAFHEFLALINISGLSAVTVIGAYAFCYTPNLASIDIVPGNLISIGASAFRMSSAEDTLDLSAVPLSIVGDMATRHKRWGSTLTEVQSVVFPRTIYLDVPNPDNQFKYFDIPWGTVDGSVVYVGDYGCSSFACYHIWNCLHAGTKKQYDNWLDWYNNTVNADGNYAENNHHDNQTVSTMITKLGWIPQYVVSISNEEQLQTIINRLVIGMPTHVVIHSANNPGAYHSIAIVGCDVNTHKIAVVDSSANDTTGLVSWIAFEDIFVSGTSEGDKLFMVDYNRPMLAPNSTWFTQGGTTVKRASITEIEIKDTYTPIGTVTSSWDASAAKDGSVMAYVEGTKLTLAGNGSGKITLNPDSSRVFSDVNKVDNFSSVTEIHNTNLLDTAQVTTFANAFDRAYALTRFDGTGWNTGNVTSLQGMFQFCSSLGEVKLKDWNTGNVTSVAALLNMSTVDNANYHLKELDLSGWNVEKVTMMASMLTMLYALEKLNLTNWKVSSCKNFNGCFGELKSLKELDLSWFDTTGATSMANMLRKLNSLQKLTLGEKFSLNGDGSLSGSAVATIPAPDTSYVFGSSGNWYDINGNAIAPSAIPDKTFGVYYATPEIADEDMNQMVLVKKGSLMKTAKAIRTKTGSVKGYEPAEFAEAILSSEG